jgi:hypothetical protein
MIVRAASLVICHPLQVVGPDGLVPECSEGSPEPDSLAPLALFAQHIGEKPSLLGKRKQGISPHDFLAVDLPPALEVRCSR